MNHLVIRGQDEPAQQPNQLREGDAVAHAAKLVETDNAVLSDSPRSRDTYLNQAHPSLPSVTCVHQFIRSQTSSTIKLSNTNRQTVVVMILNNTYL